MECTLADFFAGSIKSLVTISVGMDDNSSAMAFTISILTGINFTVDPPFHAATVFLAAFPLTFIYIAVIVDHLSDSLFASVNIFSLVARSVGPDVGTESIFLAFYPLPFVAIAVNKSEHSITMLLVVMEIPLIDGIIDIEQAAFAFLLPINPATLIPVTTGGEIYLGSNAGCFLLPELLSELGL